MNPFMMSNMFFGPMGMSVTPFCGCGVSMPYYGMNDNLTFMNFPIFRNTSSDYLLNPYLAMMQSQQSWMQQGNMFGSNMLPLFNNFPGMQGINPWWQPRVESEEEKKKREEKEAEEKKPEFIEKKAKVDEYKSYFNKLKELLDTDTKNSEDFKALESEFNTALKEDKIDDRIKKLEEVFKKLDKETLTKIALADNSIDLKLYEIGYNFPSEISKHNKNNDPEALETQITNLNLSDHISVGGFGQFAITMNDYILHILSSWNDTHDASEKGIIRGMAKHMPEVSSENPVGNQQQYRAGIEGVADALLSKAEKFKNANGGAKDLPLLCKQIEAVRSKLQVIKNVDYNNKQRVQKSDVYALADEFDKLYVMLRLIEADVMNQKVVNKYSAKMNGLIEGAIPKDIINKETIQDLKAEGYESLLSTKLDKVDIKAGEFKIKKSLINSDKKFEDKPKQELIEYLADKENGTGVLTQVGDTNVYKTTDYDGKNGGVKYYTVSDNKLVRCDKDGNVAENAPEVKASDIEKYDESLKRIRSLINAGAIAPYKASNLSCPVFKSTGKDSKQFFALIGNSFGQVKKGTHINKNLNESDLNTDFSDSDIKTAEKVKSESKESKDKKIQIIKDFTFTSLKEAKSNPKVDEISKAVTGEDKKYDFKHLSVNGYFYSKSTKSFFRYNEDTNKLEHLENVKEVNKDGYIVYNDGTKKECEENISDESKQEEELVAAIQEYGQKFAKDVNGYTNEEEKSDAYRKLNTIISKNNPLYTINFIKGYKEYGGFWSNENIFVQIVSEFGIGEDRDTTKLNSKYRYIKEFANLLLNVVDITNFDRDSEDYKALEKIANGDIISGTNFVECNSEKAKYASIRATAERLGKIAEEIIKVYDKVDS